MQKNLFLLMLLFMALTTLFLSCGASIEGPQGAVILSWDPSIDNDLYGYRILYGTKSNEYERSVTLSSSTTECVIGFLDPGEWYFVIQSFDYFYNSSAYSGEILITVLEEK